MVVDALNAGKHVFVEKTMYFKEEEGDMIHKAMEANPKLVVQVGLQRRSSVLYQVAMEMIRKGALGKIMFVRAQWHRNSNWRRPVPDPKFERLINWRMYKEYSGGLLAELASHQIDIANWAIGAEPKSVICHRRHQLLERRPRNLRQRRGHLRISGRTEAGLEWHPYNAHLEFNEQIMGDQGTLIITLGKGLYYREQVAKVSTGNGKENWWAGATVSNQAAQAGIPIFPETGAMSELGFMDREMRYAKHWLASNGHLQLRRAPRSLVERVAQLPAERPRRQTHHCAVRRWREPTHRASSTGTARWRRGREFTGRGRSPRKKLSKAAEGLRAVYRSQVTGNSGLGRGLGFV